MLKVKKQIHKKNKNNEQNEQLKNQNDLKSSIKNIYISNQTKKKTIDEYAQLTTQIRKEYAKLQKENHNLKIELEKYKHYVEQIQPKTQQKFYEKPITKRKYSKQDYEREDSDDDSDTYITEIRKRRRKPKRHIIYEDEINGISEPDTEEAQEEEQEAKPELNKNKKYQTKLNQGKLLILLGIKGVFLQLMMKTLQ